MSFCKTCGYNLFGTDECNRCNGHVPSGPEIVIIKDYDGFFEALVKDWIARKKTFNFKRIEVNSGPWRMSLVSWEKAGDTLKLDFYAAYRNGFGRLDRSEEDMMVEML